MATKIVLSKILKYNQQKKLMSVKMIQKCSFFGHATSSFTRIVILKVIRYIT